MECGSGDGLELYSFAEKVSGRLDQLGVTVRSRPKIVKEHLGIFSGIKAGDYFDGRLPVIIRKLSLDQLSALYSLFSNWYAYVRFQALLIASERSQAKQKKEFVWSLVRQKHRIDPDTKKARSDQRMSDAARGDMRYVMVNSEYEELNALYNCMTAVVETAAQDMKVISREVSIRQMQLENQFGHRPGYGRGIPTTPGEIPEMPDSWSSHEATSTPTESKIPTKAGIKLRRRGVGVR